MTDVEAARAHLEDAQEHIAKALLMLSARRNEGAAVEPALGLPIRKERADNARP